MTASKRFKQAREHLGLTQHELGKLLGFKQYKVKDIETEKQKVSPDIANNMEIFFSISGWWLLTGNGKMLINDKILDTISSKQMEDEILANFKLLPELKKEYYYHKIKAEAIELKFKDT